MQETSLRNTRYSLPSERVKTGVQFDKQLARADLIKGSPSPSEQRFSRPAVSSLSTPRVPDLSKALPRSPAFPLSGPAPIYEPKFASIWTPLSRNISLEKMTGHRNLEVRTNDLVYENISYRQVRPKVICPNLIRGGRPISSSSPLPLFMRHLSSWQRLSQPPGVTTQSARSSLNPSPAPNRFTNSVALSKGK